LQGEKAKKEGCSIAHLLSDGELDSMKQNGTIVVHVTKPYYPKLKTGKIAKEMYWTVVGSLPPAFPKNLSSKALLLLLHTIKCSMMQGFDFLVHVKEQIENQKHG